MPEPTGTDPEPGPSDEGRDWAVAATNRVVEVVDRIRSTTTQPALTATRGIVYGLLAGICLIALVVFLFLGIFRLLDVVLPGESWSAHLVLGAALCLVGSLLWARRHTSRQGG
ncbi:MAG: hypothetical protein QF628_01320 [Acidimicrobiales bacterium]|jgi:hypothetical protein|nr:hypothetical protein [Actinomycetota bacterium]MBP91501.1 hypothetical protein [Acidimicrobiaceae bacterium]MDP6177279.1 hypothetical protein [Acidimicrobiales bacterium]MBP91949.1 hypothetical protein [Acidimicrobiaceae bacterium]MDP6281119.1 hypothetical protein [Acidimicrobiales bacterium]|tara:strand:- start:1607 stop:1945 length:339 start_codon:yes stop_codon:yes gene_type:complete